MNDLGFWLGVVGGALVGLVSSLIVGTLVGGVVGAIFFSQDETKKWQTKYFDLLRTRQHALLEITVRDERGVIAIHNLVAVEPQRYLRVLELAAGGRPFTLRPMLSIVTENEFTAMRDELVERGYLVYRGERRAAHWTRQGQALLAEVRLSAAACLGGMETDSDSSWGRGGEPAIAACERSVRRTHA